MYRELNLPYGAGEAPVRLPAQNLAGVFAPQAVPACEDPRVEIQRALFNPLNSPPLSELVKAGERVVILVDDHTRSTPAALILPPVLETLTRGGTRPEDVTILVTHGTHRLSSEAEVRQKVGDFVYDNFRVEQHNSEDEANLVYLGLTRYGTPVWVNRLVVEAQRCIGIGHIGPSPYAGYSGGVKLIVPGVAGLDTINMTHELVPLGFRHSGRVDVPCRLSLEAAAALVKLDFLIDVVLSQDERLARAFAGSPQSVFQAGLALARQVYEVTCPTELDAAITSAYPYEIDLYQALRAIEFADAHVRQGGSILLVAACPEGWGDAQFQALMADRARKPEDYLRDVARRNGKVTFSVLGYAVARIRSEKKLYILSEGIPRAELSAAGFHPLDTLQQGAELLAGEYGPQYRVAVFPKGATTVPVAP